MLEAQATVPTLRAAMQAGVGRCTWGECGGIDGFPAPASIARFSKCQLTDVS